MSGWIEYAKLAVSALTPLVGGIIAWQLARFGTKLDKQRSLNQELTKKRIALYDEIAPRLNIIYCFFSCVGDWNNSSPATILDEKRAIDRKFHVFQTLLSKEAFSKYGTFMKEYFETFTEVGRPASLRLDVRFVRNQIGDKFKEEWTEYLSGDLGDIRIQVDAYNELIRELGRGITSVDWATGAG